MSAHAMAALPRALRDRQAAELAAWRAGQSPVAPIDGAAIYARRAATESSAPPAAAPGPERRVTRLPDPETIYARRAEQARAVNGGAR